MLLYTESLIVGIVKTVLGFTIIDNKAERSTIYLDFCVQGGQTEGRTDSFDSGSCNAPHMSDITGQQVRSVVLIIVWLEWTHSQQSIMNIVPD